MISTNVGSPTFNSFANKETLLILFNLLIHSSFPNSLSEIFNFFNKFNVIGYDSGWTDVLSKGLLPCILKNPAHCSNALGPNLFTFNKSFLDLNSPLLSRYETILLARVGLIPETYSSKELEAEFKSTPTVLTQFSTTPPNTSFNLFWFISCWYWPTPIDSGVILTSSAKGSCNLLAIETADLKLTSKSGNSF